MDKFRDALINKNVATHIANQLCESVIASIIGKKAGRFSSMSSIIKESM